MTQKRAVCLNCMDGRVQIPVTDWIKENCGVDHVDMITEAGMDGILANKNNAIHGIKDKIVISIEKNHASTIVIVGHHDCKGNPVSDDEHKSDIHSAVEKIKREFSNMDVIGLWVNKEWKGEQIIL